MVHKGHTVVLVVLAAQHNSQVVVKLKLVEAAAAVNKQVDMEPVDLAEAVKAE